MPDFAIQMDTIHDTVRSIPSNANVAGYVTGSSSVRWTESDWARFSHGKVRIDQSPSLALFGNLNTNRLYVDGADVADVEPSAASPQTFIGECKKREARGWWSFGYVPLEESSSYSLANLRRMKQTAGLTRVQFWVADYSMTQEQAEQFIAANEDVVAVQWAAPQSNPRTLIPGTGVSLHDGNVDLSVKLADWYPGPASL